MRRHLSAMKFLQFKLTSAAIKLNDFNLQKYLHVACTTRSEIRPDSGQSPNLNLNWKLVWQQPSPTPNTHPPRGKRFERRLILQLIFFGSPKRANVTQSLWRSETLFVVGIFPVSARNYLTVAI